MTAVPLQPDRYSRNTVATGIAQVVRLAVVLWLTPILINDLGVRTYGVWVLLFAIVEYAELLTFGIGTSFSRFVAEADGRADTDRISAIISTGAAIYLGLTVCLLIVWFAGAPLWHRLVESFLEPGAGMPFLLLLVAFLLRNLGTPYRALLNGLQRMEFSAAAMIVFQFAMAAGTVAVLGAGGGLLELALVWAAASALNLLQLAVSAHVVMPALRISPARTGRTVFRDLWGFGIRVYAATSAETGNRTIDKLILAGFLGTAGLGAAALYDVAQKICGLLLMVPAVVVPPLVPAVAAGPEPARLEPTMEKGFRLVGLAAMPAAVMLFAHASDLVVVWAGLEQPVEGGFAARLLILATMVFVLANPAMAAARGLGDPSPEMHYSILKLAINVPLSVLLVLKFGLAGVVAATFAASAISYGLLGLKLIRRYRLIPMRRLAYLLGLPLLVSVAVVILVRVLLPATSEGWNRLLPALTVEGLLTVAVLASFGYLRPVFGKGGDTP